MRDELRLGKEVDHDDTAGALFLARVLRLGLRYVRSERWPTTEESIAPLGEAAHRVTGIGGESALFEREGLLLHVQISSGWVIAQAASDDEAGAMRAFAELRQLLPTPDPVSRNEVPVTFWTYGPQGPMPSSRMISVPPWDEIEANYPSPVRGELAGIMRGFRPAHGGQLILWHGTAGTGKTFALRALAWEWRSWCELHYVVDPDSFFGQHADYLMSVLTQPSWGMWQEMGIGMDGAMVSADGPMPEEGEETGEKAWRLLVLEDTGELLTPDAKTVIGQGLSRFLNVVDGLIGQGLRVLVLVTTNEPVRALHPAVARPGRCAANVAFAPLAAEEANGWLANHDVDVRVDKATTLAGLYALAEGFAPGTSRPSTGFTG